MASGWEALVFARGSGPVEKMDKQLWDPSSMNHHVMVGWRGSLVQYGSLMFPNVSCAPWSPGGADTCREQEGLSGREGWLQDFPEPFLFSHHCDLPREVSACGSFQISLCATRNVWESCRCSALHPGRNVAPLAGVCAFLDLSLGILETGDGSCFPLQSVQSTHILGDRS